MVCNVFNGICDSFVMVLEFSVMVLLFFFSRVTSLFLYNAFLVILKAVVGLVFITTKNIIVILLCILLFEVKNMVNIYAVTMAIRTFFFRIKTMANFR